MSSDCRNDCTGPPLFPRLIENRPGLSHIGYRIGDYSDFRQALMKALNHDPNLATWTHREADDPGIALLEGASILGDILTFYQEQYANEAYLRTAQWRESVADLVRLLGYRFSPGVGGKATFAFEVKGDKPVVVPKGFPLQATLAGQEKPVNFETIDEVETHPHLSQFHLYRPRKSSEIRAGLRRLEIESVTIQEEDGTGVERNDIAAVNSLNLRVGDRLMLIPDTSMFDEDGPVEQQQHAEILIITKVEQTLDRIVVEFEGTLTVDRGETVTAYRLGRSFRHFGHNAPTSTTKTDDSDPPQIIQDDTNFIRHFENEGHLNSTLNEYEMPLDSQVNDLACGNDLICQGLSNTFLFFTVIRKIRSHRANSLQWGNLTGPTTVVRIARKLINNNNIYYSYNNHDWEYYDIRHLTFHEIKSPKLTLRAPTQWTSETIAKTTLFNYWGTTQEVLRLKNRHLLLQKNDTCSREVFVSSIPDEELFTFPTNKQNIPKMWPVTLAPVDGDLSDTFTLEDFGEENPTTTVYGNLVEATQGKTEREAAVGSGDNREVFQTFKLPKAPLTYFRTDDETATEAPELEVSVNDRLWKRVASLFGHGPKKEIYIIREDVEGVSWVQFGDGKTGSRLPSGRQNVVARYRTGIGAHGSLQKGGAVQGGARLHELRKIHIPGIATGGAEPETAGNARQAAPGKVQSLDRLVSLKDFEIEALGIAGVRKTAARWALYDGVPAVVVTVLMKGGREKELGEVEAILSRANRDRGAQRFPVIVLPGIHQYVYLEMTVGRNPIYIENTLRTSINAALGVSVSVEGDPSEGLFSVDYRRFGQAEYATRIEALVQNIEGVAWVQVNSLATLTGESDDPTTLIAPQDPRRDESVLSTPERDEQAENILLGLHSTHFHLTILQLNASEVKSDG
ncbi:MAG: hypothetical protein KJ630_04205 [Proteobacteria bacterium]|nr:hypothetical protein [Pseudomonadota bacterium]